MKKFLLRVILFFALVVVMDFAFDKTFSFLRSHAMGGSTANCEYIANRCTDDIIILGSSRATHHYVPQIIEDSLGVSCYNCGEEGNGIVLAYGRLNMLVERYRSKLVVYDVTPGFDYGSEDSNTKYLGYLRAYYDKHRLKEIFDDFDDTFSFIKMKSKMYQNTTRVLPYLYDNLVYRDNRRGYDPLFGQLDISTIKAGPKGDGVNEVDNLKLEYVSKLIKLLESKRIPLVFTISPWYDYGDNLSEFEPLIRVCEKDSIPIINNLNNPLISQKANLFQDECHLNNEGAVAYTQILVPYIRDLMDNIN